MRQLLKVKELGKLFEKGFWEGIGDYKPILSELKKDLSSIGASLKDILRDADVRQRPAVLLILLFTMSVKC